MPGGGVIPAVSRPRRTCAGRRLCDGPIAGRNLADAAHVLVFEDAEGQVELGVVILQQLDEGLNLRRVQVETGRNFAGLGQSGDGVRVFDFGKEIEHEKIDVLDFVVAESDTLGGGHFGGNVSADAQAVFVGFVDDGGNDGGRNGAVDFDLHVAEFFVVVDGGAGFGFGGDQNLGWTLIWAAAVDDAGDDDARADFFAVGDALAAGEERVGIVGEVADGGDSGGEIEQAVVVGDVGVHVPEAGKEGFAGGVDDLTSAERARCSSPALPTLSDAVIA